MTQYLKRNERKLVASAERRGLITICQGHRA